MLDWREHGQAYAAQMIALSQALADALKAQGLPVFETSHGVTNSHQFAIKAAGFGGGQTASKKLREAGFLVSGIGLPIDEVAGDMNGLRIGTPELARWGVTLDDVEELAQLLGGALRSNAPVGFAQRTRNMCAKFNKLHYIL